MSLFPPHLFLRQFKFFSAALVWLFSVGTFAADWQYTVRPTDSIWKICHEYTAYPNCWQELQGHNNITKPRKLSIGEQINIPVEWLKKAPLAANIEYIKGVVFIQQKEREEPLTKDTELSIGAKIVTYKGTVTLRFADGSLLRLSENSELIIDAVSAFKQTRATSINVSLPRGEASISVPERNPKTIFKIKTPSSVAAVRGTKFRVSSEISSETSRSEVLEGTIGFSSAGETIAVEQGYASLAEKGIKPSTPVQLIEAPNWVLDCNDPGYVEWVASARSVGYKLTLLENDISIDKVISTKRVKDSHYTFVDLENRCYQLQVNAIDAQGFNGMPSQRQLCYELTNLDVPTFNSGRLQKRGLYLDWQDTQYAGSYIVDVAEDELFSSIIQTEITTVSALDFDFAKKVNAVYVRVKARAGQRAESEYSEAIFIEREKNTSWLIGVLSAIVVFSLL